MTFLARLGLLLLAACAARATTLELEDVQRLSVAVARPGDAASLRVSGLAMHSALAVERVETRTEGDVLVVKILLAPARKGRSGSFDVPIDVPPGVERVVFGDGRREIWARFRSGRCSGPGEPLAPSP